MNRSMATANSNLLSASRARRESALDMTGLQPKVEKRFDRIGLFVEDRGEDIVGGAVARRAGGPSGFFSRPMRNAAASLGKNSLPSTLLVGDFGKSHVAALAVEVAEQRVERCDGAAGLGRVGVLAEAVPHVHADRPVVRQQQRGLPDFARPAPR